MAKTLGEAGGKFFMNKNLIVPGKPLENEFKTLREEKEVEEASKMLFELEKAKQAEIDEKLATLELLPLENKVILSPYPRNPYRKIVEGGIIVDYDGSFKNPDSGEMDKLAEGIKCAKVIETGPKCTFLQPGDDVYYDGRTVYPLPFMSLGYVLTQENAILCALNSDLKARMNK